MIHVIFVPEANREPAVPAYLVLVGYRQHACRPRYFCNMRRDATPIWRRNSDGTIDHHPLLGTMQGDPHNEHARVATDEEIAAYKAALRAELDEPGLTPAGARLLELEPYVVQLEKRIGELHAGHDDSEQVSALARDRMRAILNELGELLSSDGNPVQWNELPEAVRQLHTRQLQRSKDAGDFACRISQMYTATGMKNDEGDELKAVQALRAQCDLFQSNLNAISIKLHELGRQADTAAGTQVS
jgi:hypothetical protein